MAVVQRCDVWVGQVTRFARSKRDIRIGRIGNENKMEEQSGQGRSGSGDSAGGVDGTGHEQHQPEDNGRGGGRGRTIRFGSSLFRLSKRADRV